MLNEISTLKRGLSAAGIEVVARHADVQTPGRTDALRVRLDATGTPVEVSALDRNRVASLWTLRNGKHNSFPYAQVKRPLLTVPPDDGWRKAHMEAWKASAQSDRRQRLRDLALTHPVHVEAGAPLVAPGLRKSLAERRRALSALDRPHASVSAVITRFLSIKDGVEFAQALVALLLNELDEADDALLEAAQVTLVGRVVQGKLAGIPLLFDVRRNEFDRDVADPSHAGAISRALSGSAAATGAHGICLLTGESAALHAGNFPQPSVPVLGQIYLFSKNGDIPAAARYGRADSDTLPIDATLPPSFAGALDAITSAPLKGRTWRSIPSEKPNASDLLIAFVDGVPDAPVAEAIAGESTDETFDEETDHLTDEEAVVIVAGEARGTYLKRTERLVEAVKAKLGADFRQTPVSVLALRKVDTGNAKAILHRSLTVGGLYEAATAWGEALGNLPPWLVMPVPTRDKTVRRRGAPAITPLQLPRATRGLFIRGGTKRAEREPVGITASDALALFLSEAGAERIARAALRTVLARQDGLLSGAAHSLRKDAARDGFKHAREFDRLAALQTAGLLGLLLAKIEQRRETYMSDAAFRLGQLLAAADTVHVGFCMDKRGGEVPPTLLGNSVLATAQTDPERALSVLCRRWKPYGAWAKNPKILAKADSTTPKVEKEGDEGQPGASSGKGRSEKRTRMGQALADAYWTARNVDEISRALHGALPTARDTNDRFRAELLLGYVAGLKPNKKSQN